MNQNLLNEVLDSLNRKRKKHRIANIDFREANNVIRMDIDGKRFRIASLGWGHYLVEEIKGGILSSNENAHKISKELEA